MKGKKRKFKEGLTLIELAVVVLILGAIITLVAININPGELKDDTAALKLKKDAQELSMQLERYAQKFEAYPSEDQGLKALFEKPTTGDIPENWSPLVKSAESVKDPWGTPYILKFDEGSDYQIISLGKDKKQGGEGKNSDFNILNESEYPKDFKKSK